MTVRVIYDISVLGVGHSDPLGRTGVFRCVEELAVALRDLQECELTFAASESFQVFNQALSYLESGSRLGGVPLPHSRAGRALTRRSREITFAVERSAGAKRLALRAVRKATERVGRALEAAYPIDQELLASADIFHSPFFPIPDRVRRARRPRTFLTVYDLIPIVRPHFCTPWMIETSRRILDGLGPDDWVVCDSDSTRNDLCDYRPDLDPGRVFVTHLAADPALFRPCADPDRLEAVRHKYAIPDAPYVLGLSTLEPRKNIDHVIRSFARLVQEEGVPDLQLVLVGARGWNYDRIHAAISGCQTAKDRIVMTGYVADGDLAPLYSGAMAFVYPSCYEGFGLPPLEAMQCGVPVITSNTSSLPEVVGDAGIMLDPLDVDGLCQSLLEIYLKPGLRETMSRRSLARAGQFSWGRCARETWSAYATALSS